MYKQRVRLSNIYPFCCSAADTRRARGVFKTSIEENFLSTKIPTEIDPLKNTHSEYWEHDGDECSNIEVMTRTQTSIRDYLEFKAARSMQRFVRGWLLRNRLAKRICAAIIIQAEWRRFYYQRLTLSKVEELLASMTFKQCSDRAFEVNSQLAMNAQYAKLRFNDSAATTQIPFAGPSIYNLCEPKCVALYSERDADRKMAKILHMYEEACREDPKIFKSRVKSSKAAGCRRMYLPPPTTFCGDLIRSMKKWKIIKEKHPAVDKSIFETPQNVVNFLKEVRSEWNILHGNCHCSDAFVKELKEGNKLAGSYPTVLK
ncbi:hypothetical protein GQX74_015740 [Glossina fuscipes]|nr:hypothetical protein GQX74_015740 [Glossina fuscipes]